MLSKSLIQFSIGRWGCIPSLLFTWSQTVEEVMKIMATSFQRSRAHIARLSAPTLRQAISDPRLCRRLLVIYRQVWVSFLWGHCSFLLGPGAHKVLFVPSKSLFPQSCVSSVIKFTGLQSQILWEFSVPLSDPQVGKSVMGTRTFLTVQEFI